MTTTTAYGGFDMKQLLEDTLKAIKESGHREEDVDYVGSLDGRLRVSWRDARTILDINYPDFAPSLQICYDLCIRFKDGSGLTRDRFEDGYYGFRAWMLHTDMPEPLPKVAAFKYVRTVPWGDMLADTNYPCGLPEGA